MDSQGTSDEQLSTHSIDNAILFLGLQMSDVHLLNVRSPLQAQDLEQLQVGYLNFCYTVLFKSVIFFQPLDRLNFLYFR